MDNTYSTHNVENIVWTGFKVIEEIIDKIPTVVRYTRL